MTKFKGFKTGFNKSGSNNCDPNPSGPPATRFSGRGLPEGSLKHYPGGVANISDGNRRLAKSNHGDGGGSGTRYSGRRTAFNKSGT